MENSKKSTGAMIRNICFSVLCFCIILVPVFTRMPKLTDFSQPLSAPLAQYPVLEKYKSFLLFPAAYQDYFDSNFLLHDELVASYYDFDARLLKASSFPGVLAGKDGWLYLTDEDNITDYQCVQPFAEQELTSLVEKIGNLRSHYESQGILFFLIIAPNKESIYPESLPDTVHQIGNRCRMDQVIESLRSAGEDVLDLRDILLAGKTFTQLYYKTDTHWNDTGAFLAYQAILGKLRLKFPQMQSWEISDFTPVTKTFKGDLSNLIPMHRPFEEQSIFLNPILLREAVISEGEDWQYAISTMPNANLPRAVIFRDSFFMGLLPYMAEHFSRAVYIWSFDVEDEIIKNEKPDIVLFEIAQRYLGFLTR